jgi:hypothetical protein
MASSNIAMVHLRRRLGAAAVAAALLAGAVYLGTGVGRSAQRTARAAASSHASHPVKPPATVVRAAPPLTVTAPAHQSASWSTVARVHGVAAAWLAQRSGVTLMRFDQRLLRLALHAGSSDGGTVGWTYGDQITPREIHHIVAAFNGGFKLSYANVGFVSGGHTAAALKSGLASIVTYTDGSSDVGAWHAGVPSARKTVYSVLQNQQLLVDRGTAAANVSSCVIACWGETVGGATTVARSGLGVTANGQLVWAAGEQLLPAQLAAALIEAGAVRAIELDINPDWVAGYLYAHHPGGPSALPVVPGQLGIAGRFLEPYSRDFLTILAR